MLYIWGDVSNYRCLILFADKLDLLLESYRKRNPEKIESRDFGKKDILLFFPIQQLGKVFL